MKLSEVERLSLEVIDLKLQLLREQAVKLNLNVANLQKDGNAIIQKFCDDNKIDIKNTSVDIQTGEVKLIEENKEV